MTASLRCALRRRGRLLLALTAAAAVTAAMLPASTTASTAWAAPADPDCPPAVPVAELAPGEPVHGLTVSRGTTPDAFTGEVVGVIADGIAPGLDMVMVKLAGSVITDASGQADRGIWAGMSGSPVYGADGRLIGAVSYGLSWSPSEYAGVTPAADMYALAEYDGATLPAARSVETSPRQANQLRRSGLSAPAARAGFSRLPVPMSVSGLRGRRLQAVTERVGLRGPAVSTGSATSTGDPVPALVPGGNVAMAMSHGDVTSAGVGTVTAVCDASVLAFGHPFALGGRVTASMHNADAVFVQRDTAYGSFKVANPSAPIGVFTQDRLAGILGRIGAPPATIPVRSTVTSSEGSHRTGRTHVSTRTQIGQLATMHLLSNLDRVFDAWSAGTGAMRWTITVRRANGRQATLTNTDVYSSAGDLTWSMPWDFHQQLRAIVGNRFERVRVLHVHQRAELGTRFRQLRLGDLQVRQHGRWVTQRNRATVTARAGTVLRVRASLHPARDSAMRARRVRYEIRIPRTAAGRFGTLALRGGTSTRTSTRSAQSFPQLLEQLRRAPRNDAVVSQFRVRTRGGLRQVERRVTEAAPVVGTRYLGVAVQRLGAR